MEIRPRAAFDPPDLQQAYKTGYENKSSIEKTSGELTATAQK